MMLIKFLVKQGLIFFAIESVVLGILQLCTGRCVVCMSDYRCLCGHSFRNNNSYLLLC